MITKYNNICNELAVEFIKKFYKDDDDPQEITFDYYDAYWVGGDIGEVLAINDFFWNMSDIVQALKLNPTREQLMDWYYDEYMCEEGLKLSLYLENLAKKQEKQKNTGNPGKI